jgi:hypothetical protein
VKKKSARRREDAKKKLMPLRLGAFASKKRRSPRLPHRTEQISKKVSLP